MPISESDITNMYNTLTLDERTTIDDAVQSLHRCLNNTTSQYYKIERLMYSKDADGLYNGIITIIITSIDGVQISLSYKKQW